MTSIIDNPLEFRSEWTEGFTRAYSRYVERVADASGVIRAGGARAGKVAVVIGGGSGHYPAFAGLVGPGLVDASVIGDVFTSPSTEQVHRVARAADGGAGILFAVANYAGDVLNFALAQERLRADGVECRTAIVTDDIASATAEDKARRRGIAGTLLVFKTAGAAAARGASLEEVERVTGKANSVTRTLGVAFSGCRLPGRSDPLFSVEPGTLEVGLGIHGEPGVQALPAVGPAELADILVTPLLEERPPDAGPRAVAYLNGLGATKYEELFVLWSHIVARFDRLGIELVLPEVGEFVTSLDMAGCSLTLSWPDRELEELWTAPTETPSFRRGDVSSLPDYPIRTAHAGAAVVDDEVGETTAASEHAAGIARQILAAMLDAVTAEEDELGRLDAVAGDGDHGTGMTRGLRAALEAAASTPGGTRSVLRAAGRAFADQAGGTSGVLWGLLLESVGDRLGDVATPTPALLADAVQAGAAAVQRVGEASIGDKTLLDALIPFADALSAAVATGAPPADAWGSAVDAARRGAQGTANLRPRVGRARPLAERSVGSPDPGAISMALALAAAGGPLGFVSR